MIASIARFHGSVRSCMWMRRLMCPALAVFLGFGVSDAHSKPDSPHVGSCVAPSQPQPAAQSVTVKLNIPYAETGNPRHRLDVYRPKHRPSEKLPVAVYFHGGGWLNGDKSEGAQWLVPLVSTGRYAGVSARYRFSDEALWPAQIHDAKAVIRWVRANASTYGFDPDRIGVWGRSAGGHLALMLGVSGDVKELEGEVGQHKGVSSRVSAVVNYSGVSDLLGIIGQPLDNDPTSAEIPEAMLIGGPLPENPEKAKFASPVTYVTSDDAPTLTVHGDADRIVPYDQAVRMDSALRKVGVPSTIVTVGGAGHEGFVPRPGGEEFLFFDRYLRGAKSSERNG